MAKKTRREKRAEKKATSRAYRQTKKDKRRAARTERIDTRQSGKTSRQESRSAAKASAVESRSTAKQEKHIQKGESGYWSPEGIEARNKPFGEVSDAISDVAAAFGAGEGEPDVYIPTKDEPEEEEEIPLTEKPWFLPALIGGSVGVYLLTKDDKKKGRK